MADSTTGFFGVHLSNPGRSKPYGADLWCGGKCVHLGQFATAEEAALHVARSPEGQEAAKRAAAAAAPPAPLLTSEELRQQAETEGLTLRVADSTTGFFGVHLNRGLSKPYQAMVRHDGKSVHRGYFATAEEAALHVARSGEGQEGVQEAAQRAAAVPLTSEEAGQQVQAEQLTLRVADNTAGYSGVPPAPTSATSNAERAPCRHCGKLCSVNGNGLAQHEAVCDAAPTSHALKPRKRRRCQQWTRGKKGIRNQWNRGMQRTPVDQSAGWSPEEEEEEEGEEYSEYTAQLLPIAEDWPTARFPPAAPPVCDCGNVCVWLRRRWFCAGDEGGCRFESEARGRLKPYP